MLSDDPLWYKDAIIYELHVRAFLDSNGDGIGDFRGLTEKLDYLQDLGITAIWLLPFYPSPLRDDGYDIADYLNIHSNYGNLRDFREFLRAAHQRGLRVITELVINHTSDQHPWFQRARHAPPGSPEREFYVWSDTPDKFREARIIFQDFERSNWTWDSVANAYYWHRFYSHQPDLNYDNPAVWKAIIPALDFWMSMGVDGMRLDAIPYLYEREGTNCENLPETHAFLQHLRSHVDTRFKNRMLLAEANQWPEEAVAYFGTGNECHMAFHFPVMPRLFMAVHMEDRFPIIETMRETPTIPETCQWCVFLRNHDELTLEMVTDEERDYMYRAYARDPRSRINLGIRRRLAPLLGNNRRRIELMNGLLFSLPGTPVMYYGDEIGMGDNIYLGDRNGVRTPMQWSADRNAGFSRTNPQRLYLPVIIDPEYHYESLNVEAQQNNPSSLLWWMKRLIALRKQFKAFSRGTLEFLDPTNPKILAFLRRYEDEIILVVVNLSRFVQHVSLDLSAFAGLAPLELFGRSLFPTITQSAYDFSLGPHAFYWFAVVPPKVGSRPDRPHRRLEGELVGVGDGYVPTIQVIRSCEELFPTRGKSPLDPLLLDYLRNTGELSGPAALLKSATAREAFQFRYGNSSVAYLMLVTVESRKGMPVTHLVPTTFVETEQLLPGTDPRALIAEVWRGGEKLGYVLDALAEPGFGQAILQALDAQMHVSVPGGELVAETFAAFSAIRGSTEQALSPIVHETGEFKSFLIFGGKLILKLFRRVEEGIHPDLEGGRYLTEEHAFAQTPATVGAMEYRRTDGESMVLGVVQEYVPHQGSALQHVQSILSSFYEGVLALPEELVSDRDLSIHPLDPLPDPLPPVIDEMMGSALNTMAEMGRLTGSLHRTLAHTHRPAFKPEDFTRLHQRSVYQSMRNLTGQVFYQLKQQLAELPERDQPLAQDLLRHEGRVIDRFRQLLDTRVDGQRIRIHGDYQLHQLLFTGKSFQVIDFEGDPRKSIGERRIKRLPFRDVASLVESVFEAAHRPVLMPTDPRGESGNSQAGVPGWLRPEDLPRLQRWARAWFSWSATALTQGYLQCEGVRALLPSSQVAQSLLFDLLVLDRAIQQLGYYLQYHSDQVSLCLCRLRGLLGRQD